MYDRRQAVKTGDKYDEIFREGFVQPTGDKRLDCFRVRSGLPTDMVGTDRGGSGGYGGGTPRTDGGREPIDRVLLALSEPRRRYFLYYLDRQGDAYIDEAARFIAACERDCDPSDVSAETWEAVRRELYHVHLPKLAGENIIDYDRRSGAMCFQNPPSELPEFLELASSMELSEREIEKF